MTPAEFEAVLEAADYPKVQAAFEKIAGELAEARAKLAKARMELADTMTQLEEIKQRVLNGPDTLNAKWLDPKCREGCQSLVLKAELERVQKQAAARVGALVNAFLAWPLPRSVCSDLCVIERDYTHRSGTNLLTAEEARQMFEYVLEKAALQPDAGADYIHKDKAKSQLDAMAAVVKSAYVHKDQVKPLVEALECCRDAASRLGYIGLPLGKTVDAIAHAHALGL